MKSKGRDEWDWIVKEESNEIEFTRYLPLMEWMKRRPKLLKGSAASQRSKQSKSLFLGRRSEAKERVELRLLMRRELVGFALFFDLWVMAAAPAAMLRKEKTS